MIVTMNASSDDAILALPACRGDRHHDEPPGGALRHPLWTVRVSLRDGSWERIEAVEGGGEVAGSGQRWATRR
jgi:hypothetical protein